MRWSFWALAYWMFWIFAFVVWEAYAGSKNMGGGDVPMLTQAVVKFIPPWVTLPLIAWMFYHFAVRYFSPKYMEWIHNR